MKEPARIIRRGRRSRWEARRKKKEERQHVQSTGQKRTEEERIEGILSDGTE